MANSLLNPEVSVDCIFAVWLSAGLGFSFWKRISHVGEGSTVLESNCKRLELFVHLEFLIFVGEKKVSIFKYFLSCGFSEISFFSFI